MNFRRIYRIPLVLLAGVLILVSVIIFTHSIKSLYLERALTTVEHTVGEDAFELQVLYNNCINSIRQVAYFTSESIAEGKNFPDEDFLNFLTEQTPFNLIEFVDEEGFNYNASGESFNASHREYYIQGMKGETGVWINYKPRYSDEILMDFYTPVWDFNQNKIIGVLAGGLGGKTSIAPTLESQFFGGETLGILCDQDFNVIAATMESLRPGVNLRDYVDRNPLGSIVYNGTVGSNSAFTFKNSRNNGAACIASVGDTGWYAIQIVPAASLSQSMNKVNLRMILLLVSVIVIIVCYGIITAIQNIREQKATESSQNNIINALSSTYENTYIVNIHTGFVKVYHLSDVMSENYGDAFDAGYYDQNIAIYGDNEVYEEDRELFDTISSIEKVRKIFEDKKEYSFIYRILRNGELHFFQCHLLKPSKESSEFVAAFKNVDDLIWENSDRREMNIIQEAMNSGPWTMDFDKSFNLIKLNWSDAYRRMLGYNDETDFPNKLDSWTDLLHPDDRAWVISEFWGMINDISGTKSYDVTCRILTKNRGYRWFRSAGRISRRKDGTPIHCVGLFVDVDEQTQLMRNLSSMAGIYLTMHSIDLRENTYREINSTEEVRGYLDNPTDAATQMRKVIKNVVVPDHRDAVLKFTDLETIRVRMKGKKVISQEFISRYNGWVRASFITVEADSEEMPVNILFVTREISEEKQKEQALEFSANTDELTMFHNRHAYEDDIKILNEKNHLPEKFGYISMDLNGLKVANDTQGHEAGDELLKGAAKCMQKAMGEYGKIYRVGGDEFAALIEATPEDLELINEKFRKLTANWSGKLVKKLSVSMGSVLAKEFPGEDVRELSKRADQRMYKDKSLYYATSGIDRRGQQAAFEAVCKSYAKILKVNLTTDSFNVIQMNESEKDIYKGYDEKISLWLRNFAYSGLVAEEDLESYLMATNIEFLRDYFRKNNKNYTVHYRRLVDNKFQHVMMEMIPSNEYTDENQVVFLYVKNIEE